MFGPPGYIRNVWLEIQKSTFKTLNPSQFDLTSHNWPLRNMPIKDRGPRRNSLLPLFYELFKFAPCSSERKNGPILPTQVADQNSGFALFYFVPGLFQRFNKYCYWATKPTVHSCTRLAALDHIESKAEYNLFQCRIRKNRKCMLFFSLCVRHSASK